MVEPKVLLTLVNNMNKIHNSWYRKRGMIHNHRVFSDSPTPSHNDWFWKVGIAIVGLFIAGQILEAIAPYLIFGAIGWFLLKSKLIKF